MADQQTPRFMTKAEYARHRGVSKPYITKLAQNGVLVMRGGKVDVRATDTVLDDKPVDDVEPPPAARPPVSAPPSRTAADTLPQAGGASFGQARTIEMVFRAKLRRLEFETKQGRLIEADAVRRRIAENVRTLRDGLLGLAATAFQISERFFSSRSFLRPHPSIRRALSCNPLYLGIPAPNLGDFPMIVPKNGSEQEFVNRAI